MPIWRTNVLLTREKKNLRHRYLWNIYVYENLRVFLVAHMVKNLPAMWETQVRSLSWEDPLEKGMTPHSSILAWRISRTEEPCRLQSMGYQRIWHDWVNACTLPMLYYLKFPSIFMTSFWTTSLHKKYHFITLNKSQKMLGYTKYTAVVDICPQIHTKHPLTPSKKTNKNPSNKNK